MPPPLRLCLGGIPTDVRGPRKLLAHIGDRFSPWDCPPRLPAWTVNVSVGEMNWTDIGARSGPDPDSWTFASEELRCELSWADRRAEAVLEDDATAPGLDAPPKPVLLDLLFRNIVLAAHVTNGGLALHASAVARNGHAWAFAGPSGAGKSTLAGLCLRAADVESWCDDLALVRVTEGRAMLVRAPDWERDTPPPSQSAPMELPLARIYFLHQGPELKVEPLSPGRSLAGVLHRPPAAGIGLEQVLQAGESVLAALPEGRAHGLTFPREERIIDEVLTIP